MESTFFSVIDKVSLSVLLSIIVVGGGILIALFKYINTIRKQYKAFVIMQNNKSIEDNELRENVKLLMDKMENNNLLITKLQEDLILSKNQTDDELNKLKKKEKQYTIDTKNIIESIEKLNNTVQVLIGSDKEDIKSYIVSEYNRWMPLGYIDIHTYETIILRYDIYKNEGGNSFVHNLVEEMGKLEKRDVVS